jgi:hypothetical protein
MSDSSFRLWRCPLPEQLEQSRLSKPNDLLTIMDAGRPTSLAVHHHVQSSYKIAAIKLLSYGAVLRLLDGR